MSEFKKGDRVRVTYEGEVTYAASDGSLDLIDVEGRRVSTFDVGLATLVERPVEPLAPGSVVGYRDSTFVVTERGVARILVNGNVIEDSAHNARSLAKNIAAGDDDFTLIHDGSKK